MVQHVIMRYTFYTQYYDIIAVIQSFAIEHLRADKRYTDVATANTAMV